MSSKKKAKTAGRGKKPPSFDGYAALLTDARIVFVPHPRAVEGLIVNCPATIIAHGKLGGKVTWYLKKPPTRKARP